MFRAYEKLKRLGKEETAGILNGLCYIQEKIDGANTSIWLEDGEIVCGSRRRKLGDEDFNGFVDYVKNNEAIRKYLELNPDHKLYGEWLVRHTISYVEVAYRKFYLFDIWNGEEYLNPKRVNEIALNNGIKTVTLFDVIENPTQEQVEEYVGKTVLGEKGEGVVIKNPDFVNTFGDKCFAKVVSEKFKEDNGIVFGGNNKHSDVYWETYISNKYITLPRVKKIMDKLQPEINEELDFKHTPRVINMAYHDMLQEEIWEIAKKVGDVNFKSLKRICLKKASYIYKDILKDDTSIAY